MKPIKYTHYTYYILLYIYVACSSPSLIRIFPEFCVLKEWLGSPFLAVLDLGIARMIVPIVESKRFLLKKATALLLLFCKLNGEYCGILFSDPEAQKKLDSYAKSLQKKKKWVLQWWLLQKPVITALIQTKYG